MSASALRIPAPNWFEAALAVDTKGDDLAEPQIRRCGRRSLRIELIAFTPEHAESRVRRARIYGRRRHPARLNFGDCIVYGVAKAERRAAAVQGRRFLADRYRAGVEGLTMPELFLELFSEEIPARMQSRAADDLRGCAARRWRRWRPPMCGLSGPRRIALAAEVAPRSPPAARPSVARASARPSRRSPASCASMAQSREQLRQEGDYWVLRQDGGCDAGGHVDRRRASRRCCAASPGRSRCAGAAPAASSGCGRCGASSACWTARWCHSTCATARTMGTGWRPAISPRAIAFTLPAPSPWPPAATGRASCASAAFWWRPRNAGASSATALPSLAGRGRSRR